METGQLANLGDIATLLQVPAHSTGQNAVPGLQGNGGKPFSQVMQQLNMANGTIPNAFGVSPGLPQSALGTIAVTALNPSEVSNPLASSSGKPLPSERQLTAETVDVDEDTLLPLTLVDTPPFGAHTRTASLAEQTTALTGAAARQAGLLTAATEGAKQIAAAEIPEGASPETFRDAAQKPLPSHLQPEGLKLAESKVAEVAVERTANLSTADTASDVKTALPFELPRKGVRVEETPSPVNRTIEGLSSLSFSRSSAAAPLPEAPNQAGLTEKSVADAFTEKVVWMTGQGAQRANLQLHPAELGALQIRVTMMDNSAHVEIHAQNADTGDLLETLLPKLQSALEQQGVKVDELKLNANALFAESGEDKSREALADAKTRGEGADSGDDVESEDESTTTTILNQDPSGSVDYYA